MPRKVTDQIGERTALLNFLFKERHLPGYKPPPPKPPPAPRPTPKGGLKQPIPPINQMSYEERRYYEREEFKSKDNPFKGNNAPSLR